MYAVGMVFGCIYLYAWLDSFICVAWIIDVCVMNDAYVWYTSCICATWLMSHSRQTHGCSVLQHVAVCCSMLQCLAVSCSVLQCEYCDDMFMRLPWRASGDDVCCCATHCIRRHRSIHTATHCKTLQHTATCCNTLQHTATDVIAVFTLQHTARHCKTLQHAATHCNILHQTSSQYSHCNTLQHAATHCNTLHQTSSQYSHCVHSVGTWLMLHNNRHHCVAMCCSVLQCDDVCAVQHKSSLSVAVQQTSCLLHHIHQTLPNIVSFIGLFCKRDLSFVQHCCCATAYGVATVSRTDNRPSPHFAQQPISPLCTMSVAVQHTATDVIAVFTLWK